MTKETETLYESPRCDGRCDGVQEVDPHCSLHGDTGRMLHFAYQFAKHDPGVEWPSAKHDNPIDAICDALDRVRETYEFDVNIPLADLRAALARAAFVAEHLMQMIDPQTWRDHGGDDGQGHFEGDYHAEQVAAEIERWKEMARA